MNFSNVILVITSILFCVLSSACADSQVNITYKCPDNSRNISKCFDAGSNIYCSNTVFTDPAPNCFKACYLGTSIIGRENDYIYVGATCPGRQANLTDSAHAPCAEWTCYAQIAPNGVQLTTCGLDCPDTKLTQPNSRTGRCEMKSCASRKPNSDVTEVCGVRQLGGQDVTEEPCYQQLKLSEGILEDRCGLTCEPGDLVRTNTTTFQCVMHSCSARTPYLSVARPCGNACYQDISSATGIHGIMCNFSCADPGLQESNNVKGWCQLKECGLRTPNEIGTIPCGHACYKQINSATGASEARCGPACPDLRLTQASNVSGRCELKRCDERTPNPDVSPTCGPTCELQEDGTTCAVPPNVDEDGDGGDDGDAGDGIDVQPGQKAELGDDGSSLNSVYIALAVMLPVMGVVALISGISCIVMIVAQVKTESKQKRVDVADEEKNVVNEVIEYIEAAAEEAGPIPGMERPAPSQRKSVRKSVRKSTKL